MITNCYNCQKMFKVSKSKYNKYLQINRNLYCSKLCVSQYKKRTSLKIKRICPVCQNNFEIYKDKPKQKKHCSIACYVKDKFNKTRQVVKCCQCGSDIIKNKGKVNHLLQKNPKYHFFCDKKCANEYQIGKQGSNLGKRFSEYIWVKCENCNIDYEVTINKYKSGVESNHSLYCSRKCYDELRKKNSIIKIKCSRCQKEYEISSVRYRMIIEEDPIHKFYCSKECQNLGQKINGNYDKIIVKCNQCGKECEKLRYVYKRHKLAFCNKSCRGKYFVQFNGLGGDKRSQLEEKIESYLKNDYPNLDIIFNDRNVCYSMELDIYIPSLKLAIEINGPVHFEPIYGQETLESIQKKDATKLKICNTKHIDLSIITEKINYNIDNSRDIYLKRVKPLIESKISTYFFKGK